MRVIVVDKDAETRTVLCERLEEALRQAGLKRVQIIECDSSSTSLVAAGKDPDTVILGPGCYGEVEESISRIRSLFPTAPLGVVLANDVYAGEAIELRKSIPARVMPLADIAQMAQFFLDSEQQLGVTAASSTQGVVSVTQFKGGVGASTVATTLASCWARHDQRVALVDLDDVNPHITAWGGVGAAERSLVAEFLRSGEVPSYRLQELVTPVVGYDDKLVVCGQPTLYRDSFHFKADVLPNAASSAEYVQSLLQALGDEYDLVVIDCGRSWGISTFAALMMSQSVLFVTDDDGLTLRRSIDNLVRLCKESDDPSEFDLAKWSIVLNAFTGRLLTPDDVSKEIQELDLFPETIDLFTIPFCEHGRLWGAPGESFYDLASGEVRDTIRQIAFTIAPFRYPKDQGQTFYHRLRRGLEKVLGS